ncbi:NADH dehydrogenase [ubiquinone] 1 beta subcomplex subunit 7 [Phymastichus coffea]|uniref:NADH dehydrogenase [ubiquinone] 1 beta subcomplex subunit 7 n=1 Tax=Phymastichus coffea TaxID=108790 RepID=UPI00273C9889|nr:NADH dehydrogenase [ubiquinone] 1 beta subcomplex subunit 7 [Phymastichus coffea]
MGNLVVRTWDTAVHPELNPQPYGPTTFDPTLGFGPRKERVMIATEQELRACKIPKEQWDFCAHKFLAVEKCRNENWPLAWRCKNEAHEMSKCLHDDYILRMKEYERERRLIQRKARLEQAAAA